MPMLVTPLLSALLAVVVYLPFAGQGPPRGLVEAGQIGGLTAALGVAGDRAYVSSGPRVLVVDLADADRPSVVGTSDILRGVVLGIVPSGGFVWATLSGGLLVCLDVSAPADVRLVSSLQLEVGAFPYENPIAAYGDTLFVGTMRGVQMVDVTRAAMPRRIGAPVLGRARPIDVVADARYAYVAYYVDDDRPGGIEVIDRGAAGGPCIVAGLELGSLTSGLALAGDLLAVVVGGNLALLDVSEPTEPHQTTTLAIGSEDLERDGYVLDVVAVDGSFWVSRYVRQRRTPVVQALDVRDDRTFRVAAALAGRGGALIAGDGRRLAGLPDGVWSARLEIADIARAGAPRAAGVLELVGATADVWTWRQTVFVDGYLGDAGDGIRMIDVRAPEHPRLAGSLPVNGYDVLEVSDGSLWELRTSGDGAGARSLVRWDLAAVDGPVARHAVRLPLGMTSFGTGARVGPWLYVPVSLPGDPWRAGLLRVHAFEPHVAALLIELGDDLCREPRDVAVAGSRLSVRSESMLCLFDVTDPAAPAPLASVRPRPAQAGGAMFVSGDTILTFASFEGMRAFTLAAPGVLQEITPAGGLLRDRGIGAQAPTLRDGRLYVADATGLSVWDVTRPTVPSRVAEIGSDAGWTPYGVSVVDGIVALSDGRGGLRLLQWR